MTMLETLTKEGRMMILEPKMNVEIWVPTGRVGDVLSDLTVRRGVDLLPTSRQCKECLTYWRVCHSLSNRILRATRHTISTPRHCLAH
jgi:hypothetical protein